LCNAIKLIKFATRNQGSSAVPFQGWSVEIQPVRSTERDSSGTTDAFSSG